MLKKLHTKENQKTYILHGTNQHKIETKNTCQKIHIWYIHGRRKFRSQTSDNEKQSREEAERRERSEGKKMEMREKVGKSRNTLFFQ